MRSTGRDQASGKKYAMLKSIMISGDTSASSTDNTICPQYGIVAITTYRQGSSLIVQEIEIMRCLGLLSEKSEILLYVRVAADVAIEKIFNMSLDNDIETIIATGDTFRPTPEIPFNSSVEDIRQAVAEYSEFGVPCVITGFPIQQDDEQSPFRRPTEWIESLYANQGRRVPQLACAPSLKSQSPAPLRTTPTGPRAPTTQLVSPWILLAEPARVNAIPRSANHSVSSRVDHLVTRIIHCA